MADSEEDCDNDDAILAKAGDSANTWQASLAITLHSLQGRAKAMGSTIGPAGRLSLCCIDDDGGGKLVTLAHWKEAKPGLNVYILRL